MVDLKGMSRKDKAGYIWDYYKLHIIGALAFICIIIFFVNSQGTKIDYVFNLTILGNSVDNNKVTNLEKQLTNVVVKDGDTKKQAEVNNLVIGTSTSSQYMQKFIAEIAAGELDVVILDKATFESLVKQDLFLRLDNISGFDLASIKSEKIEARVRDKNKAVFAINAKDIKVFKDIGINTDNKVIVVISSSKHLDKDNMVLKWLLIK